MRNKINYILLAAILFALGSSNVSAVQQGDSVTLSYIHDSSSSGVTFSNNGTFLAKNYWPEHYTGKNNGETYDLVCLNPGVTAPNSGKQLKVNQVMPMDANFYGLSTIMEEGKSNYVAMSIAARTYIFNYIPTLRASKTCGSGSYCSGKITDLQNQAQYWLGNRRSGGLSCSGSGCNTLATAKSLFLKGVEARDGYTEETTPNEGEPNVAATLISSGESGENNNSFSIGELSGNDGSNTTKQLQVVEFKLTNFPKDSAYFTYDGLAIENARDGFTATEVGVSFTRATEASAFTENVSKGTNLFETYASNVKEEGETKSLTFYIAIETSATINDDDDSDETECGGDAKVKYSYKTPKAPTAQILLLTSGQSSQQDFMAILNNNTAAADQTVTGEVPLKKMKCDSDPCKPAICSGNDCEYDRTLPQVCQDDVEMGEDGNVEYKFLEAYQNGRYSIKKCLLRGKKDAAGNSYKLVDQANAAAVADNPYCSIMCKEDYVFKLPYKRQTEEGRYFNIELSLKGQQDCYSTALDYKQFNQDVLDKTVEIMEAYNKWAEYYELVNNSLEEDSEKLECYKNNCSPKYKQDNSTTPPTPVKIWVNGIQYNEVEYCYPSSQVVSRSENKKKIVFGTNDNVKYYINPTLSFQVEDNTTGEVTTLTANTSHLQKPAEKKFGRLLGQNAGTCNVNSQNIYCERSDTTCNILTADEDYRQQKASFEAGLRQAKTNLEQKVEELKEIIDELNSCNGDHTYQALSRKFSGSAFWDMIYKYDPEIKYSYEEANPTDTSTPKWIEDVRGITCDSDTCDVMFSKDEKVEAESCSGSATNCSSVGESGTVQSIFSDDNAPEQLNVNTYCIGDIESDYTCNGVSFNSISDSRAYVDSEFLNCEFKNNIFVCENKEYKQTAIDYIHKTAVASGTYETRRVYYTGHDDGDIRTDIPDQKIDNYSLVNGLPVAANTPQGTYFYILAIDNIGTFYSTGELGRVYGTNPQSLSEYARANSTYQNQVTVTNDNITEANKEIATNEYACSYEVSENSCVDGAGRFHTIDECRFGKDGEDIDWDACKKRICPNDISGGTTCVKTAEKYYSCTSENYSADSCVEHPDRQSAIAASAANYNCCPNCTVACVGKCLILVENDEPNDAKLQVDFRTVTTANMNPNSRQLGYNWDSQNGSNSLVAQKAGNTISEIEARASGQVAYPGTSTVSDYALKVTMTPDMVTWIKRYNNDHIDDGSYNNETLECYDYTLSNITSEDTCNSAGYIWQNGKCVMANVFCYSKFIDELEGAFAANIDAPNRSNAKNSANSNFQSYRQVSAGINSSEIKTNDYWTIYEYSTLDVNGDSIPDIGPSWK